MQKLFGRSLLLLLLVVAHASIAASFSTLPIADAFVASGPSGNLLDNNYGGGGALVIAASGLTNGEFQSVLKFNLSAVRTSLDAQYGAGQWSIQSVTLQLTSSPHGNPIYNDVVPGLFAVSLMQNNSWIEGTGNASNPATNGITFTSLRNTFTNNADQSLGTFSFPGGSSETNSYSLALSSGLAADISNGGLASLRLFAADNQISYLFSSRAQVGGEPQLIITAVPEPGTVALAGLALATFLWRRRET
jgi:hypothetical protein